jgi:integrase
MDSDYPSLGQSIGGYVHQDSDEIVRQDTRPGHAEHFAQRWLMDRERRRIRDVTNDRGRLTKHVLPEIGDTPIADHKSRHMRDLVRGRRANEEMAPRTLRKVYGTLHTLFRDAVIEELVEHTPCVLSSKELGPNEDEDPEWRATAVYDRDELIKLISSDALPQDRRMMYALMGLAGLRHGETAGLHWRNYDPTREPLGKLVIALSYDHATTTSKRPREVPVHPALAQLLNAWRGRGCTEILGRTPEPDDLLIPSREQEMRSRHNTRNKLLEDLERLGLPSRRGHDLRRTFITLARADGARAELLEMISHAPRGNIINIYTSMPWANLCAEVAKLNIVLPQDAEIVSLRRAANDVSPELSGPGLTRVSVGSSNSLLSLVNEG